MGFLSSFDDSAAVHAAAPGNGLDAFAKVYFHNAITVCNIIGISLMLLLSASTLPPLLRATLRSDGSVSTLSARLRLSRAVAVGIDFLVLADLIESLTVSEHGWSALLKLAAVLLIRAFISWERMIETGHVSAEHAEAMSDAAVDEGGAKSAKAKAKSH